MEEQGRGSEMERVRGREKKIERERGREKWKKAG